MNKRPRWMSKAVLTVAASILLAAAPMSAFASSAASSPVPAVSDVYTGDAAKAISLQLGSESTPKDKLITSAEVTGLFNKAVKLAGGTQTFKASSASPVTRKDAAVLIAGALKLPAKAESYKDVPDKETYASSVGAVAYYQIMNGSSSAKFNPSGKLTYEQAYALAYRIYDYVKPFELVEATISTIQKAVDQEKLTYEALTQQYLDRIEKYEDQNGAINAIININPNALEIAKALDKERIATGKRSSLHGIPIIVKDNFDTSDMPTTAGCLCLKDSVPPEDADQIALLKKQGAIILAKANLHEFAFGITTVSSLGGQTLNPYALDHYPGGSSGGTGAAIAANFALAGLGTDTGGSIRIPSSFNSLVGIRPTIGLSSRDGIIPLALTQDVGGPMARTVTDAAILLDATVGYDKDDVATAYAVGHIPSSYTNYLDANGLKGARIGVAVELLPETEAEKPVTDIVKAAIKDIEKLGATAVPVQIPNITKLLSYPSLSGYEFKFQLNEYLAELGPNAPYRSLTEIIESGQVLQSQLESMKTRDARTELETQEYKDIVLYRTKQNKDAMLKLMADNDLDAIVYPSSSQPAAVIGKGQNSGANNRLSAFTGFPAISVPAGFTADGLPVGIEFMTRAFDEPTLIKLAYAYEQGTHNRKAPALLP
ncbi:amidase family protein [Paenibacillus sp. NEAU-GSW1]|uniref:amidase family protein n=1 Tax=Paenibacillus sp. NEAU-GSW1 TaxID=2682486 RepID=UPI0012E2C969|nr:amidase family protein [Paenibacillus sp. NEAU-GSW1]MUT64574.1 amidase [Paenibacillus sp. NEAU-GSW1]